ncbi:tRNA (guanine-N(7)-)-methyltransferase [Halomicronema hongdechloris C2206]|uniref:tRNA (guanine-N(7)-)-methyltransferase n=1 Tax=Halomicronema hongdechloris C2206 TaxID=1641165 RepID=A0A1Z3HKJ6_9CYAN|nr:tRNA (guanosine(46)-N7)-methyltransferase TrmB [Halomicronema hongdechloris]ASC70842.1 tRNA (guanine-N(7)-)-methyltransferase [Halomicronema hongdechloris C2206]
MAVVRVRQHVNPLSERYQQPVDPPTWSAIYGRPQQPLHLDIGCGKGEFLFQMATLQPEWNFLGVEIRRPLVQRALQWRDQAALENLHFLFCNVNVSLRHLLDSPAAPPLHRVSIQFPDPWFKKRHQKRRVVQPELVAELSAFLVSAGQVVVQSDVEAVAQEMCDRIAEHPAFQRSHSGWLPASPFPARSGSENASP